MTPRNYTGSSPKPGSSQLLMSIVHRNCSPELTSMPTALVVPLGNAVSRLLESLADVDARRCLFGFPHPSGANGHALRQFASQHDELRLKVSSLNP